MLYPPFMQMLSVCFALLFPLSLAAPTQAVKGVLGFTKRDSALDDLWKSIPNTKKAGGNSALPFTIDQSRTDAWGTTFLYGCTALLISDPNHVVVAHMQQESSDGCISFTDRPTVEKFVREKLTPATDGWDPTDKTRVELIYSAPQGQTPVGLQVIESFLTEEWFLNALYIRRRLYAGGSGSGEAPGSPQGKAVIQWTPPGDEGGTQTGRLKVWFNQEDPLRNDIF